MDFVIPATRDELLKKPLTRQYYVTQLLEPKLIPPALKGKFRILYNTIKINYK